MGAPGHGTRRYGTGWVIETHRSRDRFEAILPPEPGERRGKVLGRYPSRYRATLELDRWLQRRRAG